MSRDRHQRAGSRGVAIWLVSLLVLFGWPAGDAAAIPALQLYIEGSTYDPVTETWVITTSGSFNLWVIGDVEQYGSIMGVNLSGAVSTSELPGTITLTPTTTSLVTDPSTPDADSGTAGIQAPVPTTNSPSADGAVPVRGDGSSLPTHGIYGAGTSFFEWTLGDFTLTDSPIGDFIDTFPTSFPDDGQINVYVVTVSGFTTVHFDAYNHIYDGSRHGHYQFTPDGHDASAVVPEPGTLILLGSGLVAAGLLSRRRLRDSARAAGRLSLLPS